MLEIKKLEKCGECSKAIPMTRIDDLLPDTIYIYCTKRNTFVEVLKWEQFNEKYMKKFKDTTEENYETEEDLIF